MMIQVPMIDKVIVVDLIDDILPVLVSRIRLKRLFRNVYFLILAMANNHYTTVNSHQANFENTHSTIEQDRDESIDSFKTDERSSKSRERFFLLQTKFFMMNSSSV